VIPLLRTTTYLAAIHETRELLATAQPGEDLVTLIGVPPDVRRELDAFCAAHPGPLGEEIAETLRMRDAMLECLEVMRDA
jgi:hypothetical protein